VQTQVEELPENRVRLTVDVPRDHVKHAVEHAASDLAGSVRIPGFRKGKVPLPVLISRVGRERLYADAVESHIGGWYWSAVSREGIHPVEQPEYDFDLPSRDDEDWRFTATVAVQPRPELPDWTTLEVPRAEPDIPQELVDAELEALRATVAELAPVDGRPVAPTDTVVLDLVRADGEAQRDYVIELDSGRLVEELEQGIVGMEAGETRELRFEREDESLEVVEVTVKEIKEKVLPPLDDELARAATEFDTLDELRGDLEGRLRAQLDAEVDQRFRADAVDALVAAAGVEATGPLVESRARELLNGLAASLERRGISFENYVRVTGTDLDELVARMRREAAQSVGRELVLAELADRLEIEVTDDEVDELVRGQAEEAGEDPHAVLERFRHEGGYERLRDDLRLRNALDRLVEQVKPISVDLARARDQLWTPDKEKPQTETKLWTPGSKEPA
jgi:trigger factor